MPTILKSLFGILYGLYAWIVFVSVVLVTTLLVAVIPGLRIRRLLARWAARIIFAMTAIRLDVRELEPLPDNACVIVANHASLLDGVILTAALPPRFGFVIKNEMQRMPIGSLLLRRLGSEFVERSDRHKGASDARRILRKAHGGEALVFFPEGTFRAEPGLGRFRSGAFAAASKGNLPVVPVIIQGSRHVLPADRVLPRPGKIAVIVTGALSYETDDVPPGAKQMGEDSRRRILQHLGEPALDFFIRQGGGKEAA
jgi:1-acyl-sn-glycerol-3-phosphate acyltransferase